MISQFTNISATGYAQAVSFHISEGVATVCNIARNRNQAHITCTGIKTTECNIVSSNESDICAGPVIRNKCLVRHFNIAVGGDKTNITARQHINIQNQQDVLLGN